MAQAWLADDIEETMDASRDDPETAWQVILILAKHKLSDDQKSMLAAGPLENLLDLYGSVFIGRVVKEAKVNQSFQELLGGVWRRDIPEAIWKQFEGARKNVW